MKGYEDIILRDVCLNVFRRKWDGQWVIKIDDRIIKIEEQTYNKLIKNMRKFVKSKDD